jgi:hypothetical protein
MSNASVAHRTTCTFTVTVLDQEDPVIDVHSLPSNIVQVADFRERKALVSWTHPTATDNVGFKWRKVRRNRNESAYPIDLLSVTSGDVTQLPDKESNRDQWMLPPHEPSPRETSESEGWIYGARQDAARWISRRLPERLSQQSSFAYYNENTAYYAYSACEFDVHGYCLGAGNIDDFHGLNEELPVLDATPQAEVPNGFTYAYPVSTFDLGVTTVSYSVVDTVQQYLSTNFEGTNPNKGVTHYTETGTGLKPNDDEQEAGGYPAGFPSNLYHSDSMSFTVTVLDNEPPVVDCPKNFTLFTDVGQSYATVFPSRWERPRVWDNSRLHPIVAMTIETNGGECVRHAQRSVQLPVCGGYECARRTTAPMIRFKTDEELDPMYGTSYFAFRAGSGRNYYEERRWTTTTVNIPDADRNGLMDMTDDTNPSNKFLGGSMTENGVGSDPGHYFTAVHMGQDVRTYHTYPDRRDSSTFKPKFVLPWIDEVGVSSPLENFRDVSWCSNALKTEEPFKADPFRVACDEERTDFSCDESTLDVGDHFIEFVVRDRSGNQATCGSVVVVRDPEPPTITCPSNVVVDTEYSKNTGIATWEPATANDNVGLISDPWIRSDKTSNTIDIETPWTNWHNQSLSYHESHGLEKVDADLWNEDFLAFSELQSLDIRHDPLSYLSWLQEGRSTAPGVIDNRWITTENAGIDPLGGTFFALGRVGGRRDGALVVPVDHHVPCPHHTNKADCESAIVQGTSRKCFWSYQRDGHRCGEQFPLGTTRLEYVAYDTRGNTARCTFDVVVRDLDECSVLNPYEDRIGAHRQLNGGCGDPKQFRCHNVEGERISERLTNMGGYFDGEEIYQPDCSDVCNDNSTCLSCMYGGIEPAHRAEIITKTETQRSYDGYLAMPHPSTGRFHRYGVGEHLENGCIDNTNFEVGSEGCSFFEVVGNDDLPPHVEFNDRCGRGKSLLYCPKACGQCTGPGEFPAQHPFAPGDWFVSRNDHFYFSNGECLPSSMLDRNLYDLGDQSARFYRRGFPEFEVLTADRRRETTFLVSGSESREPSPGCSYDFGYPRPNYLHEGSCLARCPDGTFAHHDEDPDVNPQCKMCTPPCGSGFYETRDCTHDYDRKCERCTECQ